MSNNEISKFFERLGEIWRDLTIIEFLMRCAIAKHDNELDRFPKPPYSKGRIYENPPKSFRHLSFEIVTKKFNKRYPHLALPDEIVQLRDAMAHGITAKINDNDIDQLIKFKGKKEIEVEFNLTLEPKRMEVIRQSLRKIRREISNEMQEK